MKNWINIWSIRSIISNVANPKRVKVNFDFGKKPDRDLAFLKHMRTKLIEKHLRLLGVNKVSNNSLLAELNILTDQIIKGTPTVTKVQPCQTPTQPVDQGNKNCPVCPVVKCPDPQPVNCPKCPVCVEGRECPPEKQCPPEFDISRCPSLDCQPVCENYLQRYLSQFNQ